MWGRAPEAGNGNPLQYSCLENSMDTEVWWPTVHELKGVGHDWATKHACTSPYYKPMTVPGSLLSPRDPGSKARHDLCLLLCFPRRQSEVLPVLTSCAATHSFQSQWQILIWALITSWLDHCDICITHFHCRPSPLQTILQMLYLPLFLSHHLKHMVLHSFLVFFLLPNLNPKCKFYFKKAFKILSHQNHLWAFQIVLR